MLWMRNPYDSRPRSASYRASSVKTRVKSEDVITALKDGPDAPFHHTVTSTHSPVYERDIGHKSDST